MMVFLLLHHTPDHHIGESHLLKLLRHRDDVAETLLQEHIKEDVVHVGHHSVVP